MTYDEVEEIIPYEFYDAIGKDVYAHKFAPLEFYSLQTFIHDELVKVEEG